MASRKLLVVALIALFVGVYADDSASTAAASTRDGPKHPKGLRGSFKKPKHFLAPEKFKEIMEVYEKEGGSIEEKNKKVDELTEKYSDEEKKIVEGIKKQAAKRAEMVAKLSDESKAVLKELKSLKKQEREALKKVDKKDLPIVLALLSHHHRSPSPLFGKAHRGKHGSKSTGKAEETATATAASA